MQGCDILRENVSAASAAQPPCCYQTDLPDRPADMLGPCAPDRCQTAAWPLHKGVCVSPENHTLRFLDLVCQLKAACGTANKQLAVALGELAELQYKLLLTVAGPDVKTRVYNDVCHMYSCLGSSLCACGRDKKAAAVYSVFAAHYEDAGDVKMGCHMFMLSAELLADHGTERDTKLEILRHVHNTSLDVLGCNVLQSKSACAIAYMLYRNATELHSYWCMLDLHVSTYTATATKSERDNTTAALQQHLARAQGNDYTADVRKKLRKTMADNRSAASAGAEEDNTEALQFKEKYHSQHNDAIHFARGAVEAAQKMTATEASIDGNGRFTEADALLCLIGVFGIKSPTFDESLFQQLDAVCMRLRGHRDSCHEMSLHTFRATRLRSMDQYTAAASAFRQVLQLTSQGDKACAADVDAIATNAKTSLYEMWQMGHINVNPAEQERLGFAHM